VDEQVDEPQAVDADADLRVRRKPGRAFEVGNGATPRQLTAGFDLDAIRLRLNEAGHRQVRDRDGVVDRRAVPTVTLGVEATEKPQEPGENDRRAGSDPLEPLDVGAREERLMGDVEPV